MFTKVKERFLHLFFHIENNWQVGIGRRKVSITIDKLSKEPIKWLPNPTKSYFADPFIVEHENGVDIFLEDYDIDAQKGSIRVLRLDNELNVTSEEKILETSYHLSFPFIFQHDGIWYMLPESGANQCVILYECTSYPFVWKEKKVLLNEPLTDAILFAFDSEFVLLYSRLDGTENRTIYYRTSASPFEFENTEEVLLADQPNIMRNAGALIKEGGEFIRPSQICNSHYGEGMQLNKLQRNNNGVLNEEYWAPVSGPKSHPMGFHTLNLSNHFFVIDGRKRFYSLKSLREIVTQLISKW
jgi:hypothetical protein